MRRPLSLILAASLLVGLLAAPASARWNREKPANVVNALVERSGTPAEFDRNGRDYDVLVFAALNITVPGQPDVTVADFLSGSDDITVWAPNDRAFVRTARALGYDSWDEAGVPGFLLGAFDNDTIFSILAYHVTPGEFGVLDVLRNRSFDTLNGETITRRFLTLQDKEPDLRNPRLVWPLNIQTDNDSVIHTINRVLIPVDL